MLPLISAYGITFYKQSDPVATEILSKFHIDKNEVIDIRVNGKWCGFGNVNVLF